MTFTIHKISPKVAQTLLSVSFCALVNVSALLSVFLLSFFCVQISTAQETSLLSGSVISKSNNKPIAGARIILQGSSNKVFGAVSNADGVFSFPAIPHDSYACKITSALYDTLRKTILIQEKTTLVFQLQERSFATKQVMVRDRNDNGMGIGAMRSVEGAAIYEAKKTEVIRLDEITANKAANNARQVFAKVAGLNIWENDGSGLQLNIGARGLSPNRTANFNTRQNGYDIAADPLGYPESYYTPPIEALEKIEVVRGAASLQYGTQFGGMLNFVLKRGSDDKPFEVSSRLTGGSYGFLNSFTTIGGTIPLAEKTSNTSSETTLNIAQNHIPSLNYTALYQFKRGDGWRPNSGFWQHQAYTSLRWKASSNLTITGDYTFMQYQAQQPGGLTDVMFEQDPLQSTRTRNWFQVKWNLFALTADYRINDATRMESRFWATLTGRDALGIFERINVIDFGQNRTMIRDMNQNFGNETRIVHHYTLFNHDKPSTVLVGMRLFKGWTEKQQGEADKTSLPHFEYLNPNNLENSDYIFPSSNVAVFAENIFSITPELSITPGVRWEFIGTYGDGYFKNRVFDFAGNMVAENRMTESISRERAFLLAGVGISYKPRLESVPDVRGEMPVSLEVYGNFSQNYRAIEFSDVRIVNPNFAVDPNLQDERGFNADVGVRGRVDGVLYWDVSAFAMNYDKRIGLTLKADAPPLYLPYRYRTNVADSRTFGIESLVEIDVWKWFCAQTFDGENLPEAPHGDSRSVSLFVNTSLTDARYINTDDLSILNKEVELVPPFMLRTGVTWREYVLSGVIQATAQYSYVHRHFTDATNAVRTSTAVNGIIPSYAVADISLGYKYRGDGLKWTLDAGINNLFDMRYFTRRAEGYPGPGIIPAEARSVYVTLGVVF